MIRIPVAPLARMAAIPLLALGFLAAPAIAGGPELVLPELAESQVEAFDEAESAGNEAVAAKDWPKAERLLRKAARIHGGNEGLWYNLACVQALQGKVTPAQDSLEQALRAGWSDAAWPAKDSDLAALHATPAFQGWLERVEAAAAAAKDAAPAAPASLAASAEEIASLAEAASERIQAVAPVLGSAERRRANDAIARWELASWDALARAATTAEDRRAAEWSALRSLLSSRNLQPLSPASAPDVVARADRFAREHAGSEHAATARFVAATARRVEAGGRGEEAEAAARTAHERELLQIAASTSSGEGLQHALAALIALSADDLETARGYHSRLRDVMADPKAFEALMLTSARGTHYRLSGLPEFEATTLDGRALSPQALRGKVTLLDFWATWCGPCREELPHLKSAYQKYKDRGFEIIGISLDVAKDGSPEAFKKWCAENGVTWPQVFDGKHWEAALAQRFGVKSIPFPMLLDREGRVVHADDQLRGEQLHERIESLLEAPVGM